MAANRDDGLDWLVRRMEWERTLRSLHDRGVPTTATGASAPAPAHEGCVGTSGRGRLSRPPWAFLRFPARGRFRRPSVLKIRA